MCRMEKQDVIQRRDPGRSIVGTTGRVVGWILSIPTAVLWALVGYYCIYILHSPWGMALWFLVLPILLLAIGGLVLSITFWLGKSRGELQILSIIVFVMIKSFVTTGGDKNGIDDLNSVFGVSQETIKIVQYHIDGPTMGDSAQYWKIKCKDTNVAEGIIGKKQLSLQNWGSSLASSSSPDWWPRSHGSYSIYNGSYSIYSGGTSHYEGFELWIPKRINKTLFLYRGVY